jgi:hypothetical protein
MRLETRGYRRNGRGEVEATLAVIGEDGGLLLEDMINLSRARERHRFARWLGRRLSLGEERVEGQLVDLLRQARQALETSPEGDGGRAGKRTSQADRLVRLVEGSGCLLFHDELGEAYARVLVGGHGEVWRCRGKDFKRWLAYRFWTEEGKTPHSDALNSTLNVLEGRCRFEGPEYALHNRVAAYDGAIYYDLADDQWQVVRVSREGWSVEPGTPVPLFRRYPHQRPQVAPVAGGDPFELTRFLNLREEEARLLALIYAITCFIPDIPHPIPVVHGPGGSTKTTFCRLLRALVDPSALEVLSFPWQERELVQKLAHHWLAPFDNVSTLPGWVQDSLCRAATGEGFSKRELYSDDDDIIYSFRRCVLLNGVNIAATNSDLLRRAVLFALEEVSASERRSEAALWADFHGVRPYILGGMWEALSRALALADPMRTVELPTMADFALWGQAIAEALGKAGEAFLQAYLSNISQQHAEAIDSNTAASVLVRFMEGREIWEGSPSQLYSSLKSLAQELELSVTDKQWPRNPSWLMRSLNTVKTNLKAEGIVIGQTWDRGRMITLSRVSPEQKGDDSALAVAGGGMGRPLEELTPEELDDF